MTSWKLGTVEFTTYGYVTMINDYMDFADRRGENVAIPHRHGSVFVEKYFNERKIAFGFVVVGADSTALETAMDTLRKAMAVRAQQTLEMTMNDASKRQISVAVNESLQVERVSDKIAKTIVNFTAASPFWHSDTAITDNTLTIDASPHAMTVTNTGTVEECDPTIIIAGPFTSITLTNSTNGAVLTYTGAIDAGETVTIGTLNGEFYATHNVDGNVIGNVTHSGSSALLPIEVGNNTLAITSAGGDNSGTVKITFYPPFI